MAAYFRWIAVTVVAVGKYSVRGASNKLISDTKSNAVNVIKELQQREILIWGESIICSIAIRTRFTPIV